jgi:hypothetical protein
VPHQLFVMQSEYGLNRIDNDARQGVTFGAAAVKYGIKHRDDDVRRRSILD